MKNQFDPPLRARLRDLAESLKDKSSATRLATKKAEPSLNPAPMKPTTRIKGWLNAHDLLGPRGRR